MFERFTERARATTARAQEIAVERGSSVQTVDLLSAMTEDQDGLAGRVLKELGVTTERIDGFNGGLPTDAGSHAHRGGTDFSDDCKRVLEVALREALALGHNYIGTEHLLLALVRGPGNGEYLLRQWNIAADAVRTSVVRSLQGSPRVVEREGKQQTNVTSASTAARAEALVNKLLGRMERDAEEGMEMHSATLANLARALESLASVAREPERSPRSRRAA